MNIPYNIDRRVASRYKDSIQVDLQITDDEVIPVEICSISEQGIQFNCDAWLVDEIEPKGVHELALNKKDITIKTKLPFDGISKTFVAHSTVNAVRRLSQDKYLIGLSFNRFEDYSKINLDEYIEQLREESD